MNRKFTYTSMVSNSSRFLWRLRNAAARFFTNLASRLLRPETSGGMKSLVVMRSPAPRGLLETLGAGLCSRFDGAELLIDNERRSICGEGESDSGEGGLWTSGKSNTWWVGRHSWSFSDVESGLIRILIIWFPGAGELVPFEPVELGGDGGKP